MNEPTEFFGLNDAESAAIAGGTVSLATYLLPIVLLVVAECIKYSAEFKQGWNQGLKGARTL